MEELELTILRRLYGHGIIGARHAHIESVVRGMPKHLKGEAMKAVKELIKDGFIIPKPTGYGTQIALNPNRITEIRKLIGES
ncbi:MAG: hypothetical protein HYY67_00670 [Thaumarchaeota archaeon]|nr:hypothetical protein [Nitrososphaerota archaeon]